MEKQDSCRLRGTIKMLKNYIKGTAVSRYIQASFCCHISTPSGFLIHEQNGLTKFCKFTFAKTLSGKAKNSLALVNAIWRNQRDFSPQARYSLLNSASQWLRAFPVTLCCLPVTQRYPSDSVLSQCNNAFLVTQRCLPVAQWCSGDSVLSQWLSSIPVT